MRRGLAVGVLLAGLLGVAGAAVAEQTWVEAAGVARAEPGEAKGGPGRQAALRAALSEAVLQVATGLLAASEAAAGKPPSDPAALAERAAHALGGDPTLYVTRYQIREDRGVQPRLLLADPDATAEYQLVVAAQVDVARVRQRVGVRAAPPANEAPPSAGATQAAEAPPPEPTPGASFSRVRLEVDGIASYREYASVRAALVEKVGARSALPVEFRRGRAVLDVDSPVSAADLPAALGRALAGTAVSVDPLPPVTDAPEGEARVRIRAVAPGAMAPGRLTR